MFPASRDFPRGLGAFDLVVSDRREHRADAFPQEGPAGQIFAGSTLHQDAKTMRREYVAATTGWWDAWTGSRWRGRSPNFRGIRRSPSARSGRIRAPGNGRLTKLSVGNSKSQLHKAKLRIREVLVRTQHSVAMGKAGAPAHRSVRRELTRHGRAHRRLGRHGRIASSALAIGSAIGNDPGD